MHVLNVLQLAYRKDGFCMKKLIAGVIIIAAAAATAIAIALKKNDDDELTTLIALDEETPSEPEDDNPDPLFSNLTVGERNGFRTRIKFMLEPFAGNQQVLLSHYCEFKSQNDLFEAVKQAKALDYTLAEADEKHRVQLDKVVANYFDDVYQEVSAIADATKASRGHFIGFNIKES